MYKDRDVELTLQKSGYDTLLDRWMDMEKSVAASHRDLEIANACITKLQKELFIQPHNIQRVHELENEISMYKLKTKEIESESIARIERSEYQCVHHQQECEFIRKQLDNQSKTLHNVSKNFATNEEQLKDARTKITQLEDKIKSYQEYQPSSSSTSSTSSTSSPSSFVISSSDDNSHRLENELKECRTSLRHSSEFKADVDRFLELLHSMSAERDRYRQELQAMQSSKSCTMEDELKQTVLALTHEKIANDLLSEERCNLLQLIEAKDEEMKRKVIELDEIMKINRSLFVPLPLYTQGFAPLIPSPDGINNRIHDEVTLESFDNTGAHIKDDVHDRLDFELREAWREISALKTQDKTSKKMIEDLHTKLLAGKSAEEKLKRDLEGITVADSGHVQELERYKAIVAEMKQEADEEIGALKEALESTSKVLAAEKSAEEKLKRDLEGITVADSGHVQELERYKAMVAEMKQEAEEEIGALKEALESERRIPEVGNSSTQTDLSFERHVGVDAAVAVDTNKTEVAELLEELKMMKMNINTLTYGIEEKESMYITEITRLKSLVSESMHLNKVNEFEEVIAELKKQIIELRGTVEEKDKSLLKMAKDKEELIASKAAELEYLIGEKEIIEKSYRDLALIHSACDDALLASKMETAAVLSEVGEQVPLDGADLNIQESNGVIKQLRSEVEAVGSDNEKLKLQLSQLQKELADTQEKLIDSERVARIQANLFESQKSDASSAVTMSEEIQKYEALITSLRGDILAMQSSEKKDIDKLEQVVSTLKADLQTLQTSAAKSESEHISTISNLKDEIQTLKSSKEELVCKLMESQINAKSNVGKTEELQKWREKAEDIIASHTAKLDEKDKQIAQFEANYKPLGDKIVSMSQDIALKDEEKHELEIQIQILQKTNNEMCEISKVLESELLQLKKEHNNSYQLYVTTREELKSTANKYKIAKKKIHLLETLSNKNNERMGQLKEVQEEVTQDKIVMGNIGATASEEMITLPAEVALAKEKSNSSASTSASPSTSGPMTSENMTKRVHFETPVKDTSPSQGLETELEIDNIFAFTPEYELRQISSTKAPESATTKSVFRRTLSPLLKSASYAVKNGKKDTHLHVEGEKNDITTTMTELRAVAMIQVLFRAFMTRRKAAKARGALMAHSIQMKVLGAENLLDKSVTSASIFDFSSTPLPSTYTLINVLDLTAAATPDAALGTQRGSSKKHNRKNKQLIDVTRTSVVTSSIHPQWNQEVQLTIKGNPRDILLICNVFSSNIMIEDTFMGQSVLKLSEHPEIYDRTGDTSIVLKVPLTKNDENYPIYTEDGSQLSISSPGASSLPLDAYMRVSMHVPLIFGNMCGWFKQVEKDIFGNVVGKDIYVTLCDGVINCYDDDKKKNLHRSISCRDVQALEEFMYDQLEIPFEAISIRLRPSDMLSLKDAGSGDTDDFIKARGLLVPGEELVWGWANDTMICKQHWRKALINSHGKGFVVEDHDDTQCQR